MPTFDALGIDRAAVLAGSAGTTSALELAVRHPDRVTRLVLLSSNAPGPQHDTDGIPEWLARRLWASGPVMWAVARMPPGLTALMGIPPDLPLGRDDRSRLQEELDSIFPVSRPATSAPSDGPDPSAPALRSGRMAFPRGGIRSPPAHQRLP